MNKYPGFVYSFLFLFTILIHFVCFAPTGQAAAPVKSPAKKKAAVRKTVPSRRTSATTSSRRTPSSAAPVRVTSAKLVSGAGTQASIVRVSRTTPTRRTTRRWVQTWDEPTFKDSTDGDAVDGEDLVVRKAAVVVGNLVDRQSEVRNAGPGELLPIETVHFHVKQGREDCIQFVYDELTKPPSAPAGAKAPASRAKPSLGAGNWKLLGRFKTEAQAQAAAEKSEAAYQAEPHWEPSDE